jgi:hypothetical protein
MRAASMACLKVATLVARSVSQWAIGTEAMKVEWMETRRERRRVDWLAERRDASMAMMTEPKKAGLMVEMKAVHLAELMDARRVEQTVVSKEQKRAVR